MLIANIADAGDGNPHPLLVVPAGDDGARARAERAFAEIIDAALVLGSTGTGEHGVGLLKRKRSRGRAFSGRPRRASSDQGRPRFRWNSRPRQVISRSRTDVRSP
ncbi:FAD-linked oxidase C-terminal domain-containing protein [Microbacterium sp.]|uniref:FAD-linked oxidase C-terminal domain-containing protein n=1 Tax=Microbacterium sp. TaxID=51671 RepID=UPI003BAF4F6C